MSPETVLSFAKGCQELEQIYPTLPMLMVITFGLVVVIGSEIFFRWEYRKS